VPRKRSISLKDPLDNWQTLCKREAREVGLFRASPWSTKFPEVQYNGYSRSTNLYPAYRVQVLKG